MDKFYINGVEISPPDGFKLDIKADISNPSGGRTYDGELWVDKRIRIIISKIEEAFGFELYDWQKAYLFGVDVTPPSGRRSGRTFIYCVRLLLCPGKPIPKKRQVLRELIDENHGHHYKDWFADYLMEINQKLVTVGFKTRMN